MANGLLNFLSALSSNPGQRLGAGLSGLGAGLLQAGAPRVGAPGPNAWGAGLGGFTSGMNAYDEKQRGLQMQDLQKQIFQAKLDEAKRAAAEQQRIAILKNQAMGMTDGPTVASAKRMNAMGPRERLAMELAPEQWVAGMYKEPKTLPEAQRNAAFLFPDDPVKQRDYVNTVTTMSKAPVVNVNNADPTLGPIPSGQQIVNDPSAPGGRRLIDIPGGKNAQATKAKEAAYKTFAAGLENLGKTFGQTTTGPGLGWLPAFTPSAQSAEQAGAIMANILKPIFRESGEGTFTEGDQRLLMSLIPTRNTLPQAVPQQIQMIDTIVRIKLGMDPAPAISPSNSGDGKWVDVPR